MRGFGYLRKVVADVIENELAIQVLQWKGLLLYKIRLSKARQSQCVKRERNNRLWGKVFDAL